MTKTLKLDIIATLNQNKKMSEDNLQPVELSVRDIADAKEFEKARGEIYKSTQTGDSERMHRLTELAGSMAVNRGNGDSDEPVSIQDRVLDILTSGEPVVGSHDAMKYRISVDPQGNVTEISRVLSLPEDTLATDRARRRTAKVPWGPKQNHSSFKRDLSKLPRKKKVRV
ncbi:hypothetical protein A3E49_01090 [Candidatus Saccharibacteria bacterium RIFCSPHIGHO2_12_FULL_49_19]|nr:MAG: hypothetical protein A2708_00285 [Candidatus Saccharibacteria bacterium RIFCSPHIGHO2_01_FULL_49_21]OGL37687.1 MAG: hypothetical protein A3E49_01090 [Candidatus Saccharibacteria bacterium RIFCSPHIGHO2_12_FULL_49_19]